MYSNTLEILSKRLDPRSVLEAVIERITDAERCYPVEKNVRDHFNRANGSWGRNWGESRGDIEEIKVQKEFLDPGFIVHFTYDEYSRGCHMGTSRYKFFVPDNLVKLYEQFTGDDDFDAETQFDEVLETFVKDRIASITTEMIEADQAKKREEEANNRAYEAEERSTWERLNSKYRNPG